MTKTIAVLNQKGGVGKSTISFHLSHAAKEYGRDGKPARTLVLDMDSQANLSQYLTRDLAIKEQTEGGVGLLLEGRPLADAVVRIEDNLDLLHGHKELDRYDTDEAVFERCLELRPTLDALGYDVIVIDTPPALGLRHLMPMVWADLVVIPMEPVQSSIGGFHDVLSTMDEQVLPLNPRLKWLGVVNRMNKSVASHRSKEALVRELYGEQIAVTFTSRTAVSDAMEDDPAIPVWARKRAPADLKDLWLTACRKMLTTLKSDTELGDGNHG